MQQKVSHDMEYKRRIARDKDPKVMVEESKRAGQN
jgi:hypothetical protein